MHKDVYINCLKGNYSIIGRNIFFILLCLLIFTSCDCEGSQEIYRNEEASIVLDKLPKLDFEYYKLYGRDPVTNKDTIQQLPARWLGQLYFMYEIGDTIIKEKGSLSIHLHKMKPKFDTIKFECISICDDYITNGQDVDYWRKKLISLGYL